MIILTPLYDASFDGVDFFEAPGAFYPDRSVTTEGGVLGSTFIDLGEGAEPFELAAGVDESEWAALMAKRGDVGTLVFSGSAGLTCKLLAVLDRPGLAGNLGAYSIVLRFLA